jgi:ABC-type sugar transport system permease subunit
MNATGERKGGAPSGASLFSTIVTYGLLGLFLALCVALVYGFAYGGNTPLAVVVGIIGLGTALIFFIPSAYPIRWMAPGLGFVTLLVIYPIYFTVSNAFTNYGDGHLLNKQQSVELITNTKFVPDDASVYSWDVMKNEEGKYALWLTREVDGKLEVVFAPEGVAVVTIEGDLATTEDAPESYEGYTLLKGAGRTEALGVIQTAVFGIDDDTVGIKGRREAARPLKDRYVYNEANDTIVDQSNNQVYVADQEVGQFIPQNGQGDALRPGYIVSVGIFNFTRFVSDPNLRGPLIDIFVWTVTFSFFSAFLTFAMGLAMALVLNAKEIVGRKVIQSLLIIPYAMPGIISIMVWRALLNENEGLINTSLINLGIISKGIPWLGDPVWAKVAILLVNLWLGYPYMMLICSGALQAIPSDVYEAAAVDGANPRQKFWSITLPLLLVTIGPLLIATFTYNFNNFMLIDVLTGGNPPILGSPVPAGYTDILISYTYRLAFGSRGADYGYASAITLVIFALVALVTVFQTRFTKQLEKISDNA